MLSDIFINEVGKRSQKKMENFACDNKLLTTRNPRKLCRRMCPAERFHAIGRLEDAIPKKIQCYQTFRNAFEEKNTDTVTDPALVTVSESLRNETYFCENVKCA